MTHTKTSALLATALLCVGTPTAALATPGTNTSPANEPGTGTIAEGDDARAYLDLLRETQSEAEIQQVLDSELPANVLYDLEADKPVAAYITNHTFIAPSSLNLFQATDPH